MRVFRINQKDGIELPGIKPGTGCLTERQYKSLLKRFRPENYAYDENLECWVMQGQCVLCKDYSFSFSFPHCLSCPLAPWENPEHRGCMVFISAITGQSPLDIFHLTSTKDGGIPEQKLKALALIRAILKMGKKEA